MHEFGQVYSQGNLHTFMFIFLKTKWTKRIKWESFTGSNQAIKEWCESIRLGCYQITREVLLECRVVATGLWTSTLPDCEPWRYRTVNMALPNWKPQHYRTVNTTNWKPWCYWTGNLVATGLWSHRYHNFSIVTFWQLTISDFQGSWNLFDLVQYIESITWYLN